VYCVGESIFVVSYIHIIGGFMPRITRSLHIVFSEQIEAVLRDRILSSMIKELASNIEDLSTNVER